MSIELNSVISNVVNLLFGSKLMILSQTCKFLEWSTDHNLSNTALVRLIFLKLIHIPLFLKNNITVIFLYVFLQVF